MRLFDAWSRASQDVKRGAASREQALLHWGMLLHYAYLNGGELEEIFARPAKEHVAMADAAAYFGQYELAQLMVEIAADRGPGKVAHDRWMAIAERYYYALKPHLLNEKFFPFGEKLVEAHSLPTEWR